MDTFQQQVEYLSNGTPRFLRLRYIFNPYNRSPGPILLLRNLAAQIQRFAINYVRSLPGRSRRSAERILNEVKGYLGLNYGDQYSRIETFTLAELIDEQGYPELLNEYLERIQQSNAAVTVEDAEWLFYFDTDTLQEGGGGNKPFTCKYKTNAYKLSYQEYQDEEGPIACAAVALVCCMYYSRRRYDRNVSRMKRDARSLQIEMGWDQYVPIPSIPAFVKKYPQYRLTIVLPGEKHLFNYTYEGTDGSQHIYIGLDNFHYFGLASPQQYIQANGNKNNLFCKTCCLVYDYTLYEHECGDWMLGEPETKKRRRQKRWCPTCKEQYEYHCSCNTKHCRNCDAYTPYKEEHRCILIDIKRSKKEYVMPDSDLNGKRVALWAYDIESRVHTTEEIVEAKEFEETVLGKFTGTCRIFHVNATEHKANLIVAQNVFTGERHEWFGDDCLQHFLMFMKVYNRGNNLCYAHNGSGYDSRLLINEYLKRDGIPNRLIMRGTKILKMDLDGILFHDTMLHLTGSLRSLAKDYCSDLQMEKGYFPHLFNSTDHYGYVGPIPDKKYFDLGFSMSSERDLADFNEWYDSWSGREDWSFDQELKKYCINDVDVLAHIMKRYHDILMNEYQVSPWFKTTGPGFVHDMILSTLTKELELPDYKEQRQEYASKIEDLAYNSFWAVLQEHEYDFARKALRGGRTEIRKIYHRVTDEEWNRGIRIRYQDICSQYPYQQAIHDFPVGIPTHYVWDPEYRCPNAIRDAPVPTIEELLQPEWFGIVCATVIAPPMFHPVLIHFDSQLGKTVAACGQQTGYYTSVEFQCALRHGYQLVKLHRFDKYNRKPSLWREMISKLYLEKMASSQNLPSEEEQARLIEEYDQAFGIGDMMRDSFEQGRWEKNPARKRAAKILVNSAWGKHAQRLNLPTTEGVSIHDTDRRKEIFNAASRQYITIDRINPHNNVDLFVYQKKHQRLDYTGTYLPAALFVPAYGRLQLWEQLHQLGDRVLMNDTDSIIYIYDPTQYNIPEGSRWGQWEVEDIDTVNGGIREFVGIGPKTYSLQCENGVTQTKCKGISLKYGVQDLVNHQTMKDILMDENNDIRIDFVDEQDYTKQIKVPQMQFSFQIGGQMKTRRNEKILKFGLNDLKGNLGSDGRIYPFGYHNV